MERSTIRRSSPSRGGSPPSHLFRSGPRAPLPSRAPGRGRRRRRFRTERLRPRWPARFARCVIRTVRFRACSSGWLERTPDKREVGSSSLPRPTTRSRGGVAQLGERLLCKQEGDGSIPFTSTSPPPLRAAFGSRNMSFRSRIPGGCPGIA